MTAIRDHRDDGAPFLGIIVAVLVVAIAAFAVWGLVVAFTSDALINGPMIAAAALVVLFLRLVAVVERGAR